MTDTVIQKFEMTVVRADMAMGDDIWQRDYVAEMRGEGFSMKGGLFIGMKIACEEDEELMAFCYVPVARRAQPIEREPANGHEASLPEFMEYRAFPTGTRSSLDWGASVVNALIASNRGKLPIKWREIAMSGLDTPDQRN